MHNRASPNRKWMPRAATLLLTLALVVTSVGAATAKGRPVKTPAALYDVSLSLASGVEGLGTCADETEPQFLTMADIDGALSADGSNSTTAPRLHLRANVPWTRSYPEYDSGDGFDGCHGGMIIQSQSDVPSYFVIHGDRSGNVVSVLWAFDVYVENGVRRRGKTSGVKEYFRLWATEPVTFQDGSGDPCPLIPTEPVECFVSGAFEVWHYYPIEQIGLTDFTFTMTIGPSMTIEPSPFNG